MKKKVFVLSYSHLENDPRPYRQIKALKLLKNIEVHTMGTHPSGLEDHFYEFEKSSFLSDIFRMILLKFKLYNLYFWDKKKKKSFEKIRNTNFDLVIINEIRLAPFMDKIAKDIPIILDAHEYSPKNFDDNFLWRFFIKEYYLYLCKKYIPKVDLMMTVSPGIATQYEKDFGVKPILFINASEFVDLQPSKCDPKKIKIIHHGITSPSRKQELMIELMSYLDDRFELYLMLIHRKSSWLYYRKLKKMAKNNKRIHFLNPVPRKQLIEFSNSFDLGIHFVPPTNFNLRYGLGNKFFEFIQSRLGILIGPDIEMSKYVNKYDLGIISTTWKPKDMADILNELSLSDIERFKTNSHKAAKELGVEKQFDLFNKYVNRLISENA